MDLQYLEYEIAEQYINYHHQFFDEVKVDLDILTDLKEWEPSDVCTELRNWAGDYWFLGFWRAW